MWSIGTRAPPRSSWTRAQARSSPPRIATPSRCRARRAGAPVPLPVVGARPRLPLVAMELARRRDRQTDRRALTLRPDMVEVIRGDEDEVASPRAHGLGLPLDLPVDLALDDEPPLVHEMVVAIVGMTGRLADQGAHDLLVDHDLLRPGRRPFCALDRVEPRMEVPRSQEPAHRRLYRGHGAIPPRARVWQLRPGEPILLHAHGARHDDAVDRGVLIRSARSGPSKALRHSADRSGSARDNCQWLWRAGWASDRPCAPIPPDVRAAGSHHYCPSQMLGGQWRPRRAPCRSPRRRSRRSANPRAPVRGLSTDGFPPLCAHALAAGRC